MCANTQLAFIKRIVRCEKQINKQKATSLRETAGFDFRAKAFNNTILFHAVSSAGTCGGRYSDSCGLSQESLVIHKSLCSQMVQTFVFHLFLSADSSIL